MNRPEARNALSAEMMAIMREAWDRVDSDPSVRVCILTGAGGAFCAGADLKAMTASHPGDNFSSGGWDLAVIEALLKGRRLKKPLIAAVEGPAIAGGTEILQATDIRIAGESPRFGVSEARWGLFPLGGSAVRLVRQIPYTVAADLLLTGRHLSAQEACRVGLIGHVVPDGQALDKAMGLAEMIAANGPVAVRDPAHDSGDGGTAGERGIQSRSGPWGSGVHERGCEGGATRLCREAKGRVQRPLAGGICRPEECRWGSVWSRA